MSIRVIAMVSVVAALGSVPTEGRAQSQACRNTTSSHGEGIGRVQAVSMCETSVGADGRPIQAPNVRVNRRGRAPSLIRVRADFDVETARSVEDM